MTETIIEVPYHEQFDGNACAAACLRMTLESIGGPSLTEAELFTETKGDDTWSGGSSPVKLARAFKTHGGQKAATVVVAMKTGLHAEAEVIIRMIWSIHNAAVPPIALVAISPESFKGDGHWVVVAGYEADRHPTGPDDTACVVSALFMNNPAPVGDQVHPDHVTYDWWRRRYMKRVGNRKDGNVSYEGSVVAVAGGTVGSA